MGYHEVASSSASDDWPTPGWLVDRMAAEFGEFDLDPAASAVNAKAGRYFTRDDDGLSQPWKAHRVWCNPPYGRAELPLWAAKARQEVANGNAELVVALVPVRTSARWWRELTDGALVRYLPRRLRYRERDCPHDSAVVILGKLTGRHGTAATTCTACRAIFWPAYACRKTCSERCRKADYRARRVPDSA